jgi:hypothetical protein
MMMEESMSEFEEECRANPDEVDWNEISRCQTLSEGFIRENADRVDWYWISRHQALSEDFIREHADRVDWIGISRCQTLSEDFIREHADRVDWYWISRHQALSEDFIREHADRVDWIGISCYQTLSEDFIREHVDKVDWDEISRHQTLSEGFIREFADRISVPEETWRCKTPEEKLEAAREAGYEIRNGKVVAFKSVRRNLASVYQPGLVYAIGKHFRASNCDCLPSNENSFGLSAWTREGALGYYSRGKLLEVEVDPEDLGVIVHNGSKIRCFGFRIVRKVGI